MVQSRFATYYQNHPETNDISLILETSSTTNKSPLRATSLSQKEIAEPKNSGRMNGITLKTVSK